MTSEVQERYSFSKLSSFHNCKYGFKLTYIDHKKGVGNCFSAYGNFVHSLMERYAKGEIELWDLPDVYRWEFDIAVPDEFPISTFCKNMRDLYYRQGLDFLKNFPGFSNAKILDVETAFDQKIEDWIFNGIIDLTTADQKGNLIIQDYKSKGSFKSKREKVEYTRQLYLYSLYVKQKYGKYPLTLRFILFRKQTVIDIPFNKKDFREAIDWAKKTVDEIRECWDYVPNCSEFFSSNLCNHRQYCDLRI